MNASRRSTTGVLALSALTLAAPASAQFGRRHNRSDSDDSHSSHSADGDRAQRGPGDPAAAIARELPSLRIDLKIAGEQAALFDSFERQVRNAAEAGRMASLHAAGFRRDDGTPLAADTVLRTLADDAAQRAEATRLAVDSMTRLAASFTPDQQKQFDARLVQALRDPLGTS